MINLWKTKHLVKAVQIDDDGEGYVDYEYDEKGHCIAEQGVLSGGHQYRNVWKVDNDGNRIRGSKIHLDM